MPSGHAYTKAFRTCKTCVGTDFCRYGVGDSTALGIAIEKRFQGIESPHKMKLAATGCPRNCAEATTKDLGAVAIEGGRWEVYVGGAAGSRVRKGDMLCVVDTHDDVLRYMGRFMQYYREHAKYLERTYDFVERVGIEALRRLLVDDAEGIAARLDAAIQAAVDAYRDPWQEADSPGPPGAVPHRPGRRRGRSWRRRRDARCSSSGPIDAIPPGRGPGLRSVGGGRSPSSARARARSVRHCRRSARTAGPAGGRDRRRRRRVLCPLHAFAFDLGERPLPERDARLRRPAHVPDGRSGRAPDGEVQIARRAAGTHHTEARVTDLRGGRRSRCSRRAWPRGGAPRAPARRRARVRARAARGAVAGRAGGLPLSWTAVRRRDRRTCVLADGRGRDRGLRSEAERLGRDGRARRRAARGPHR